MEWVLTAACVALAFANGANDNIKGVATLVGSAQLAYQPALLLATASQIARSLGSILVAGALVTAFSGKGLVPPELFSTAMLAAVVLAAAATVGLATRFGLPVSTTHVSTGGIFGIGASNGTLQRRASAEILGSWLATLPLAAALGAAMAWALGA